jgi:hypothetical protein
MPTGKRDREANPGKGRNAGQGLGNITDTERRDLTPSGDDAPTKDQAGKVTSGEQGQARPRASDR